MPRTENAAPQSPGPPNQSTPPAANLLGAQVFVINIGLESFAAELSAQGVPVTHVQWSPPAGGDEKLAGLLAKLGM